MRLRILDSGHGFSTKALFALIRTVSRQPVLDVINITTSLAKITGHIMCFYEKVKKVKADEGRPGDGSSRARNLSVLKRKRCSQPA